MSVNVNIGSVPTKLGEAVRKAAEEAITQRGSFSVAISGGSLPKLLAEGLKSHSVDIEKWDVFLADERVVPLDHKDSNYREIRDRFPSMPIIPIDPSLSSDECAIDYTKKVVQKLGQSPKFDMLLLGLGPDGHTCSLFPGHPLVRF
ncbi:Glucosamine/galactosamine-6-phosphate isomerase [Gracilaria domingensis]|nr:Glucosamine/galactosamine-6-phosphate isomerase [Gracilaria domingensis]